MDLDQDRELFKLQVAAQHYESKLQMAYNMYIAAAVGVMFFALTAVVSNQMPLLVAMGMFAGCFVTIVLVVAILYVRDYHKNIKKLDEHLKNLERGQPAPSLAELTKD
jgi:Flp pilus assembly protein TadB